MNLILIKESVGEFREGDHVTLKNGVEVGFRVDYLRVSKCMYIIAHNKTLIIEKFTKNFIYAGGYFWKKEMLTKVL